MKLKDQNGGALIEFAICLPLLVLLLFGIIEFGILLFNKAVITNASREGARYGIVLNPDTLNPRMSNASIQELVDAYCADYLFSFGSDSSPTTVVNRKETEGVVLSAPGDSLAVSVSYPFKFLVLSNLMALTGSDGIITLNAETIMRLE